MLLVSVLTGERDRKGGESEKSMFDNISYLGQRLQDFSFSLRSFFVFFFSHF
jgi:hypothetical protein